MTTPVLDREGTMKEITKRPACDDDDVSLSDDWIRENIPLRRSPEDCYSIECAKNVWFEVDMRKHCFKFLVCGAGWNGKRLQTRGNVRDLLWLLGAELIP